jgi:hypothetical protein
MQLHNSDKCNVSVIIYGIFVTLEYYRNEIWKPHRKNREVSKNEQCNKTNWYGKYY